MSALAARKAARVVDHVTTVLAVELLCAAQALDHLRPLVGGRGVEAGRLALRRLVPHLARDRRLDRDISLARGAILDDSVLQAASRAAGPLR